MSALQRTALKDLDPNVGPGHNENSTHTTAGALEKTRPPLATATATPQVDHSEHVKTCKERDTLVEEVRKLTRELSKLREKEPEQSASSGWAMMTSSTREMRRLEDELRDLREAISSEKVWQHSIAWHSMA
jgi:hypothetical protein